MVNSLKTIEICSPRLDRSNQAASATAESDQATISPRLGSISGKYDSLGMRISLSITINYKGY